MYQMKPEEYKIVGNRVYLKQTEFPCPKCKRGKLHFYDYCKRYVRKNGDDRIMYYIPRCRCSNPACTMIHRMIPDFIISYRQYDRRTIKKLIGGTEELNELEYENGPCRITVTRWEKVSSTLFRDTGQ